jgi:DNA-binding response OmpR family regulator
MSRYILVVDDDPSSEQLLELCLRHAGYEMIRVSSGREAIEVIEDSLPDLVLLDVMMPDIDGFEVCRRVRANPLTAAVPIVMLTTHSSMDAKLSGFEAGADDFLFKPVDLRELVVRLRAILRRTARRCLPNSPTSSPGKNDPQTAPVCF